MEAIALVLGIGTGILSVLTFLGGTYAYIKSSATKKYAAEREIGHLNKTIEQLTANILFLEQEFDRRLDSIDMKLLEMNSFLHRINDSNSTKNKHLD